MTQKAITNATWEKKLIAKFEKHITDAQLKSKGSERFHKKRTVMLGTLLPFKISLPPSRLLQNSNQKNHKLVIWGRWRNSV